MDAASDKDPRVRAVSAVLWSGQELDERSGRLMAVAAQHVEVADMVSIVLDGLTPGFLWVMDPKRRGMSWGKLRVLDFVLRAEQPLHLRESSAWRPSAAQARL